MNKEEIGLRSESMAEISSAAQAALEAARNNLPVSDNVSVIILLFLQVSRAVS